MSYILRYHTISNYRKLSHKFSRIILYLIQFPSSLLECLTSQHIQSSSCSFHSCFFFFLFMFQFILDSSRCFLHSLIDVTASVNNQPTTTTAMKKLAPLPHHVHATPAAPSLDLQHWFGRRYGLSVSRSGSLQVWVRVWVGLGMAMVLTVSDCGLCVALCVSRSMSEREEMGTMGIFVCTNATGSTKCTRK